MENVGKTVIGLSVEPFYFGGEDHRLYGVHHLPSGLNARNFAIVLCPPIGQEYIRSHRSFVQLAVRLARIGFHVLRFDYFGCGDSAGNFDEGSTRWWVDDIRMAMREIAARSALSEVCLVGLRMGATLAYQAAVGQPSVKGMIMWEPIVDGPHHLEELVRRQTEFASTLPGNRKRIATRSEDILGFPFLPQLKREIAEIHLDEVEPCTDIKLLLLCTSEKLECTDGMNRFRQRHQLIDFKTIADHAIWVERVFKRLIPLTTLQYLVHWLGAVKI